MARSRGFPLARSQRRRRSWEIGPGSTSPTSFTTSAVAIIGNVAQATADGITLARIRGQLNYFLHSGTALGDGFQGAFGICIVPENAFGVGVTAVPTPIADVNWDGWMYHHFISSHIGVTNNADGSAQAQVEVDTKAMRKLKNTDGVIAVVELIESGSADLRLFFDSRMLALLP